MPHVARLFLKRRVYWCWFYDADRRRIFQSCRTRDRTTAERVALELERAAVVPRDPGSYVTTEDACSQLISDRRTRGRAQATLDFLDEKSQHLLRVLGPETPLSGVTASAVDRYTEQRITEGASRYTVAHELGVLRAVLRLMFRRGLYQRDPRTVLPLAWDNGYKPRRRSLTRAQLRKLLAELPSRSGHLSFLVATGARWGESVRAQPEDWGNGLVYLRGTKTDASRRLVPILAHVLPLARKAKRSVPFPPWPNARRDIQRACARAEIPIISPNDLRRTAATWLVEKGVPSNLVGQMLGHVDSRMVEWVYGRVEGAELKRAIETVTQWSQRRPKTGAPGGRRAPGRKRQKRTKRP